MQIRNQSAEKFLKRIKENIFLQTDPMILRRIFNELKLNDFKPRNTSFSLFLHKLLSEPVDISALVEKIESSLLEIEPISLLAAYIQDNELITDAEIQKAANAFREYLNLLCFCEAFVVATANSPMLAEDIYCHIRQQRKSPRPGNAFMNFFFGVPYRTSFIERLKMIVIDRPMLRLIFHKLTGNRKETIQDVEQFIKKHRLSGSNAKITPVACDIANPLQRIPFIAVNMMQAAWLDAKKKSRAHVDNATAGVGLIAILEEKQYPSFYRCPLIILPKRISVEVGDKYPLLPGLEISQAPKKIETMELESKWIKAYLSWLMFWCVANFKTAWIHLVPFIPSILAAESNYFIELRVISSFLFLNLNIRNPSLLSESIITFKNSEKIFSKWAKLNKEHVENLSKTLSPNISKDLTEIYRRVFGNIPSLSFFFKMLLFFYDPNKFYVTPYGKNMRKNSICT